jgi:hypothetical protein
MRKVVIPKMSKFPYDIAVNKPVPGKRGFENSKPRKEADTKPYHGNGKYAAYKSI